MFSFIPLPYRILIAVGILAATFSGGVYGGHHLAWLQEEAKIAVAEVKVIDDIKTQDAVTEQVAEKAAEKQIEIRTVYRTITKEIKVHVPAKADAACIVPVGFVRVWNAAASGVKAVPEPAGEPDDATPSDVGLTAIAGSATVNGETYRAVAQQLTDLQAWVRTAQANWEKGT